MVAQEADHLRPGPHPEVRSGEEERNLPGLRHLSGNLQGIQQRGARRVAGAHDLPPRYDLYALLVLGPVLHLLKRLRLARVHVHHGHVLRSPEVQKALHRFGLGDHEDDVAQGHAALDLHAHLHVLGERRGLCALGGRVQRPRVHDVQEGLAVEVLGPAQAVASGLRTQRPLHAVPQGREVPRRTAAQALGSGRGDRLGA
mmetsp:Transcript_6809/g.21518  ORF Transcript_6809/g.21518 Transcript_6809/m.21518 type:complete len:200 (+) Transcript_6809:1579-2178(+)